MRRWGIWGGLSVILALPGISQADEKPATPPQKSAAKPIVPPDHAARVKAGLVIFKEHVRPLLTENCLKCHGGEAVKADFDLSTRKALMDSGMVGETAADSHLFAVTAHTMEPHMPLKQAKLHAEKLAHLEKWLDLGAPYDAPLTPQKTVVDGSRQVTAGDREFWSFQRLGVTAQPRVQNDNGWVHTPIDRFVLRKLHAAGIEANPEADRRTLIRRASLDLLGLPPTPAEVESFVNAADPRAYEKLIDRLLDSPHYGERWARHWMDVARFGESHGYEQDYNRSHAYHYRDFLIWALNSNLPYDQFVQWQIAGDELQPDNSLAMMATGFLGGGAFPTQLTEMEFESARYDELDDMTGTTGTAILGLTVGCARCHDHKFDPIPTRDYYRMVSSFATTIRSEIDLPVDPVSGLPKGPLTSKDGQPPTVKVQVTSEGFPHTKHHADGRGFPHFYPQVHFLNRGDVQQKDGVADPGFLQVLMTPESKVQDWKVQPPADWKRTRFSRASLANWLTDVENGAGHLAARVIVNRLWHHHFGRGLVATPNDFGLQGEPPSHPELLEWLAGDLVHNGWKLKRLHKLIMLSAVYRQSAIHDEARANVDRENTLLWRWQPRRLEAEAVRDALLSTSGLLDRNMYGPGTLDQNMRRRSVYFFIKRSQLIPVMMLFDWPEHLVGIGRRGSTTVAPQALAFLNSPQCRQYAEGLAKQVTGESPADRVSSAYRLAYQREPAASERTAAVAFLTAQTTRHQTAGIAQAEHFALVDLCQALMSASEFIYIE